MDILNKKVRNMVNKKFRNVQIIPYYEFKSEISKIRLNRNDAMCLIRNLKNNGLIDTDFHRKVKLRKRM